MPDFGSLFGFVESLLKIIFGAQLPPVILRVFAYASLILLTLGFVWATLFLVSGIIGFWQKRIRPVFYNAKEKRRSTRRRRFAEHVESEIRRLNRLEEWSDYRFAELEAEVEAEGRRRVAGILPFLRSTRSGLRRENSLSKALQSSEERLILVEGEPGSGKSIALRHVAQAVARRAMKSPSTKSVIPVYVNLKELERSAGEAVNRELIQAFVLGVLNRVNDRDIEEFLEEEFDKGLEEGTWLFLFDSFDELPEVLSSTESDARIREYSDAIYDFLHGMNQCRGIIASRHFRGPGQLGWPRFRILPLSEKRRLKLIAKADLTSAQAQETVGRLELASHETRSMAANPMFLGLLCEHMRGGNAFPESAHSLLGTYLSRRFARDKDRLLRRFNLEPEGVRTAAESIAFTMAADPNLGLSPTRVALRAAVAQQGLGWDGEFDIVLDALEYLKLARSEMATAAGESQRFTLAHRKFQEYFATCVVLREPDRVSPRQLLTDGRWRETAVTMCQTQPAEALFPIFQEARRLLSEMNATVAGLIEEPLQYVDTALIKPGRGGKQESSRRPFQWPQGALHIVTTLQEGFGSRLDELPDDVRLLATRTLLTAYTTGCLFDTKWALEVAGIALQPVLLWLLRAAFASDSQWLKETAYRQAARLATIPPDMAQPIRVALLRLLYSGRLRADYLATRAHLARLDNSTGYINALRLLRQIVRADLVAHIVIAVTLLAASTEHLRFTGVLVALALSHWSLYVLLRGYASSGTSGILCWCRLTALESAGHQAFYLPLFAPTSEPLFAMPLGPVLFLVYFYLLSWAPMALSATEWGVTGKICWWPTIPIWPIVHILRSPRERASAALRGFREVGWKVALVILVVLASWCGLLVLVKHLTNQYPDIVSPIVGVVVPLIAVGVAGWYLYVIILAARLRVQWLRCLRHLQTPMGAPEFVKLLLTLHPLYRPRFVRAVRERDLLTGTEDAVELLAKLVTILERPNLDQKGRKAKDSATRRPHEAQLIDELCILLEGARVAVRGRRFPETALLFD